MITCEGAGRLGNQMFRIATTLGLAYKNGTLAVFPYLKLPPSDSATLEFYAKTIFHSLKKGGNVNFFTYEHKEPFRTSTIYHEIPFVDGMMLRGHFQSYKYFDFCRDLVIESFKLPNHITEKVDKKYKYILESSTTSIHVRRGDYLSLVGHYEILDAEYYKKALALLGDDQEIVVFSDDIEWCKSAFNFIPKEKIHFIEGEEDICDLYLMSKIKNNIISNSTFSWWSAYLNDHADKKIIAPWKWFGPKRVACNYKETADLIPENWIRI